MRIENGIGYEVNFVVKLFCEFGLVLVNGDDGWFCVF